MKKMLQIADGYNKANEWHYVKDEEEYKMTSANVSEMEEVLKNMKIGDTVFHNEIGHIHRVIGGWIYQFNNGGVFVPYSEPKTESDELTPDTTEPKRRGRKPIITK